MKRREFMGYLGSQALGLTWTANAIASSDSQTSGQILADVPTQTGASGRVIVVGGGMGGASVSKYLRHWGGDKVDVILIDPRSVYISNILSNQVVEGTRTLDSLGFSYNELTRKYGIRRVHKSLVDIDTDAQRIELSNGRRLSYDRLVLSPGVDFDIIPGLETVEARRRIPHAWKAGAQTLRLRNQLARMQAGGTFVITIPPPPYRCPPGPYERACVVADFLKRNKPGSKVLVLDANPEITAGKNNFSKAFNSLYSDIIEYHSSVEIWEIDAKKRILDTSKGELKADVINAIPVHRAADIIGETGLTDNSGRWAGVDMQTYESTAASNIHIIGDASSTTQPKAGHIANAEAKVCADAIIQGLKGKAPNPVPVTNSSCYTPITHDQASWLSVVYRYDPVSKTMKPSGAGGVDAEEYSRENFLEMLDWFENLMLDTFT